MQKHINCVIQKHISKQCMDAAETDTIVTQSLNVEANVPVSNAVIYQVIQGRVAFGIK